MAFGLPRVADAQTSSVAPAVAALLRDIKAADADQLAVSEEDGRFLRVMVTSSRATTALEIGSARGYSAIWIGLGLRETGGHLTTIEFDPERARLADANIRKAGLGDVVTVISGDAFARIPKLGGEFDFVFLDAWKRDYKRFFDLVQPRLRKGGVFLAHNVVNKQSEMLDFLTAIQTSPAFLTSIVIPGSEGMSVSVKIRRCDRSISSVCRWISAEAAEASIWGRLRFESPDCRGGSVRWATP